jgi:hypothetical protein
MSVNFILDRFEGEEAILKTEDGKKTVVFPKEFLPAGSTEGAALNFKIFAESEAEEEKRKTAKDILNEILNIDDNN